jgi:hypothetical protein
MKPIKTIILGVAATLLCTGAFAQSPSSDDRRPDYSNKGMQRLFAATPLDENSRFVFTPGAVQGNFGATRVRAIAALPPLQGSQIRITQEWPDPFALTGVSFPIRPGQYHREDPLRALGIDTRTQSRPNATLIASNR